jgi:NADPH:quinone reductase
MLTSRSMRALVLKRHSGPFILTEAELPTITVGQVLVRIKASGVSPLDTKIRAGNAAHARVELPAILGMDLAGVVEVVGPDVTAFKPVQSLNRRLRRSADSG